MPGWLGTPLEPQNTNSFLETGTLFCLIGDPTRVEAVLVIDQGDVDFIHRGQGVAIKLDELPAETLSGSISEIAEVNLDVAPRQLATRLGGELATRTDRSGIDRPMNASYQARVALDDPSARFLLGLRGRAKIQAGTQTLGQRFWRYLSETFHFRL